MKKGPRSEVKKMGPLKMAHLNGLSVSRQPMYSDIKDEPERASNDERVGLQQSPCNENESGQLLGSCKCCRSVHVIIYLHVQLELGSFSEAAGLCVYHCCH